MKDFLEEYELILKSGIYASLAFIVVASFLLGRGW